MNRARAHAHNVRAFFLEGPMNAKQRSCMVAGLLAMAVIGIVPPWTRTWEAEAWSRKGTENMFSSRITERSGVHPGGEEPLGHHPLFSAPTAKATTAQPGHIRIDY